MPIAQDASTPSPSHLSTTPGGVAVSASFSPPSNSLVVIAVVWMFGGLGSHPSTLSVADSLANAYTKGVELDNIQETTTAIYTHYYVSAPGSITITVTCSSNANAAAELVPLVLTGCNASQAAAAFANDNDDGNLLITTTTPGSWVITCAGAPNNTRVPTADVTLTQLDFFSDVANTGNQAATGKVTVPTSVPGRTWTGWKSNMAQAVALEVLPAAPILQGNGGNPGPVWQTGQVLASADCNAWLVPLAQQKLAATSRSGAGATTLQPDPDLQLPFISAGNWYFRLCLMYDGPTSADLHWGFTVPAGCTLVYMAAYQNTSSNQVLEAHTGADTPVADTDGVGNVNGIVLDGMILMGVTPGSVSLLWGQNVQQSAAVTVYQASYFTAWRLG